MEEERTIAEGRLLFKQGDPADDAFLIKQGSLKIIQEHEGNFTELGVIVKGEIVGEMALLSGGKAYSASAEATEEVLVDVVRGSVLKAKLETGDATMRNVIQGLINRLYNSNKKLIALQKDIAATKGEEDRREGARRELKGERRKA